VVTEAWGGVGNGLMEAAVVSLGFGLRGGAALMRLEGIHGQ
jgi:hypothetical protein